MNRVLEAPILGLESAFPEQLYVVFHAPTKKYGCFCFEGVHGLACFSDPTGARRFSEFLQLEGICAQEVSFDEAREIAKARPMPIISLMLLDQLNDPKVHYVK